jgi:SHS2 domain-containing protein
MPYTLIDHTADLGIRVLAVGLRELFEEAAAAMFDLISDGGRVAAAEVHAMQVRGRDRPDLMVNWLRELLYLWNGDRMLVARTRIDAISEQSLSAQVWTEGFDPGRHELRHEIKAVTYHGIAVRQGDEGWEAVVIFDV